MTLDEEDIDITRDTLSLVNEWPADLESRVREVIASWTTKQRLEAYSWAGLLHLRASDNDDVYVPIEPEHVFDLRQQIQAWRGDGTEHVTHMAPIPAGLSGI